MRSAARYPEDDWKRGTARHERDSESRLRVDVCIRRVASLRAPIAPGTTLPIDGRRLDVSESVAVYQDALDASAAIAALRSSA